MLPKREETVMESLSDRLNDVSSGLLIYCPRCQIFFLLLMFLHLNFISSVAFSMKRDSVAFSKFPNPVPEF